MHSATLDKQSIHYEHGAWAILCENCVAHSDHSPCRMLHALAQKCEGHWPSIFDICVYSMITIIQIRMHATTQPFKFAWNLSFGLCHETRVTVVWTVTGSFLSVLRDTSRSRPQKWRQDARRAGKHAAQASNAYAVLASRRRRLKSYHWGEWHIVHCCHEWSNWVNMITLPSCTSHMQRSFILEIILDSLALWVPTCPTLLCALCENSSCTVVHVLFLA